MIGKSERDVLLQYGEHLVDRDFTDKTKITIECEIPIIRAVDFKPTAFIPENIAMASLGKDIPQKGTIHYFLREYRVNAIFNKLISGMTTKGMPVWFWDLADQGIIDGVEKRGEDYRIRRIQKYDEYIDNLRKFEAVCSPDYSVYASWCNPNNLLDVWKNRLVGNVMQSEGLTVIPTISWSDERTFEYAFLGVEKGGTYAVSATGCNDKNEYRRETLTNMYRAGIKELVRRLEPCRIIVHGNKELTDAEYGKADVMFFPSKASDDANYRAYGKDKITERLEKEKIENVTTLAEMKGA